MTRRWGMLGAAAFTLIAGCAGRPPAHEEAFIETLVALNLLEARADELRDVSSALRDSVIVSNGFTEAELRQRLHALARNPAESDTVLAIVERRLAAMAAQPRPADSLSQ